MYGQTSPLSPTKTGHQNNQAMVFSERMQIVQEWMLIIRMAHGAWQCVAISLAMSVREKMVRKLLSSISGDHFLYPRNLNV